MQNIWISLVTIPYIFILRAPPNAQQSTVNIPVEEGEVREAEPLKPTYCQSIKLLLKNRSYVFLVIAYSMMIGINCSFGACIYPLFQPLGFSTTNISTMGVLVVFFGVVSSMMNGVLLKCYNKFLLMVRVQCFGTFIFLSCAVYLFQTSYLHVLALNMIVGAMFLVPMIPIGIAFAAELTFPVDETVSQGFL